MFEHNTRVRFIGELRSLKDRTGTVVRSVRILPTAEALLVRFDHDGQERVVYSNNLELIKMPNFKSLIATTLSSFDVAGLNPKDEAARRLGIAYELASAGEKAKKAAKKSLKGLGLLADAYPTGSEVIYDSEKYQITADTKEPASVIKVECLQAELQRRGMSGAVIAQIVAASYGTNKPATTLVVVEK